jgi:hypothetical protein
MPADELTQGRGLSATVRVGKRTSVGETAADKRGARQAWHAAGNGGEALALFAEAR